MIVELAAVVNGIAAGVAQSNRPEDRQLGTRYLAVLAPILAGAIAGKDVATEMAAFERLLGQTWIVDEAPFREALSAWRQLFASTQQGAAPPHG